MRGVDGEIYALAQGALTATGIDASAAGSKVAIGVPTAGRIPSGAIVERMVETPFEKAEHLVLNLRDNDFSTSSAIVAAINSKFGPDGAQAVDGTFAAAASQSRHGARPARSASFCGRACTAGVGNPREPRSSWLAGGCA
jgi:flagellar P-ring protein precursor FlgI